MTPGTPPEIATTLRGGAVQSEEACEKGCVRKGLGRNEKRHKRREGNRDANNFGARKTLTAEKASRKRTHAGEAQ